LIKEEIPRANISCANLQRPVLVCTGVLSWPNAA